MLQIKTSGQLVHSLPYHGTSGAPWGNKHTRVLANHGNHNEIMFVRKSNLMEAKL